MPYSAFRQMFSRRRSVTGLPGNSSKRPRAIWPDEQDRFDNRTDAGRRLGAAIAHLGHPPPLERCLVLGLPRGGIPVACEVARVLAADLDVVVPHRVTPPWRRDVTVGAIVDEGPPLFDWDALSCANTRTNALALTVRESRSEVRRRQLRYRGDRPSVSVATRSVVIADDGLTPSVLARAAVRTVRAGNPHSVIFAAPVCAAESADWLRTEADLVLHLHCPRAFHAVGMWYRELAPVTDDDVARLLATAWGEGH